MKYEADIIKDIVDSRGHTKTSIHYQSECVEEWVKEVEGAYPKLCDYRPEWLNYSNENKIGVFPYITLTDVTSATVENVVPYAYKSASLKGNTLVNLSPFTNKIALSSSNISETKKVLHTLNQNTKYILIFNINNSTSSLASNYIMVRGYNTDGAFNEYGRTIKNFGNGRHYILLESTEGNVERIFIGSDFSCEIDDTILTIYQDGMENWDIPYFTGMQSVKLPGLTAIGKNLFDIEKLEGLSANIEMIENGIRIVNGQFDITSCFITPFKENTQYTISFNHKQIDGSGREGFRIYYTDGTDSFILPASNSSRIGSSLPNKTIKSVSLSYNDIGTSELTYIKFEEGSTATSYEPFKSNILTSPEDLELRGIGKVKDELDLLTGELTERLITKTYDGSENWGIAYSNTDEKLIYFQMNDGDFKNSSSIVATNNLVGKYSNPYAEPIYNIMTIIFSSIRIRLGSEINTLELFKDYLSKNNLIITAERSQNSVKTVDLSVVDQGGKSLERIKPLEGTMHLNTSGETIKPLFSGEIPVEAITQNLASFIEE